MTFVRTEEPQETFEQYVARQLSVSQWEFLTDHFEGTRKILTRDVKPNEDRTRNAMLSRKLVYLDPPNSARPTHTILTTKGHGVMCAAMGMMADMLSNKDLASEQVLAIEDWYTLAPSYRTKEKLVEMVTRPRRFAYGKITPRETHKVDG